MTRRQGQQLKVFRKIAPGAKLVASGLGANPCFPCSQRDLKNHFGVLSGMSVK